MLKWIAWNRTDFDVETVQRKTKLFEIELFCRLTVYKQKLYLY